MTFAPAGANPFEEAGRLSRLVDSIQSGRLRVVDLTRALDEATPVAPVAPGEADCPGFMIWPLSTYDAHGPLRYWNGFSAGEHTGTHFEAPAHWVTGQAQPDATVDLVPAWRLVGPACVVDVAGECAMDADFLLTREHVTGWERVYGRVPAGAWLLVRTGWSQRVDPASFLNVREDGPHWPGFSRECAEYVATGQMLGVGVDTISLDAGRAHAFDPPFPMHHFLLGSGKCGLASLTNLDQLPPTGAVVIAAPLKIAGGSGSPMRALALVPA